MPPSIDAVPLTHSNELTINRIVERPEADFGVSVPLQMAMERRINLSPDQNWMELPDYASESWTFFSGPDWVVQLDDLHVFTSMVSRFSGVTAVLAEKREDGERHITTFIEAESERLVELIIGAQADIIERYCQSPGSMSPSSPSRHYSFHIRVTPRNDDGEITLPLGHYSLIPWQP